MYRIAAASTRGASVDNKFTSTACFDIYSVDHGVIRFEECRQVSPTQLSGTHGADWHLEYLAGHIRDCHAVLATEFSARAAHLLDFLKITPVCTVEGALTVEAIDSWASGALQYQSAC